jgi:BlaI family transcriptional regulator, penicillinase repressor
MTKHNKPTESELEILNILWDKGPSTVRDVHEVLAESKEAGYTTSLKLMQIMFDKGLLKRDASAKTHIYEAAVSQEQTQGQMLKKMIDTVFNGSASRMVMQALGNHKASAAELDEIKQYLESMEKKTKKSK